MATNWRTGGDFMAEEVGDRLPTDSRWTDYLRQAVRFGTDAAIASFVPGYGMLVGARFVSQALPGIARGAGGLLGGVFGASQGDFGFNEIDDYARLRMSGMDPDTAKRYIELNPNEFRLFKNTREKPTNEDANKQGFSFVNPPKESTGFGGGGAGNAGFNPGGGLGIGGGWAGFSGGSGFGGGSVHIRDVPSESLMSSD